MARTPMGPSSPRRSCPSGSSSSKWERPRSPRASGSRARRPCRSTRSPSPWGSGPWTGASGASRRTSGPGSGRGPPALPAHRERDSYNRDIKPAQVSRPSGMPSVAQPPARRSRLRRLSYGFFLAGLCLLVISSAYGAGLPARPLGTSDARALGSTGGPGGGTPGPENLTVNLTDAPSFDPRNLEAVAGAQVHFVLNNTGSFNHTFTISAAAGVVLPENTTPAALDHFLTLNGTLVNVSLPGGSTLQINYTVPGNDAGDSFEFVSQVPYQFQAGMFGFFNVTLDPASFNSYFSSHPPAVNVVVPGGSGATAWANFTVPTSGAYEYICEVSGHFVNGMFGWLYVGEPVPVTSVGPSTAIVQPALLAGAGVLLGIGVLLTAAATFTGRFPRRPPATGGH